MPQTSPSILRMATLWEGAIVATTDIELGRTFAWGDGGVVFPEGTEAAEEPFVFSQTGWELDPKGVTGGTLHLRGRDQSASDLDVAGPKPMLQPGDHALLEYGPTFRVFVQHVRRPLAPPTGRVDGILLLALALALAIHVFVLVLAAKTQIVVHPPLGQSDNAETLQFYGVRALSEPAASALRPESPPPPADDLTKVLAAVPTLSNKVESVVRKDEFRSVFIPLGGSELPRPIVDEQGLTQDEVNKAITSQKKALAACLQATTARGSLTLRWDVDPAGNVANVATLATSLNDPKAEACIIQQIRATRFPARKAPTTVTSYPIKLGG